MWIPLPCQAPLQDLRRNGIEAPNPFISSIGTWARSSAGSSLGLPSASLAVNLDRTMNAHARNDYGRAILALDGRHDGLGRAVYPSKVANRLTIPFPKFVAIHLLLAQDWDGPGRSVLSLVEPR